MLEARSFVKSFDRAKEILNTNNAVFKDEYKIRDIIYKAKDPNKSLTDEFLRLRIFIKNIWGEKDFIVAIKNTIVKEVGKNSIIQLKVQFDTEAEAKEYVEKNLLDRFEYLYEFDRVGWQYFIGKDVVDLEDFECHLSLGVKSKTESGLKKLVELFELKDVIKVPSVVAIKELLKK